MNKTIEEWRVASSASSELEDKYKFYPTTNISISEIAMNQLNLFFERVGTSEEKLMEDFIKNRGEVFERYYGTVDAASS
jgi:hypothetical protein